MTPQEVLAGAAKSHSVRRRLHDIAFRIAAHDMEYHTADTAARQGSWVDAGDADTQQSVAWKELMNRPFRDHPYLLALAVQPTLAPETCRGLWNTPFAVWAQRVISLEMCEADRLWYLRSGHGLGAVVKEAAAWSPSQQGRHYLYASLLESGNFGRRSQSDISDLLGVNALHDEIARIVRGRDGREPVLAYFDRLHQLSPHQILVFETLYRDSELCGSTNEFGYLPFSLPDTVGLRARIYDLLNAATHF